MPFGGDQLDGFHGTLIWRGTAVYALVAFTSHFEDAQKPCLEFSGVPDKKVHCVEA
jgi:hypothetical protein